MPTTAPPFTIRVEAGFDEEGIWIIDGRVAWRDGPPPVGSPLLGKARLELLIAIGREGLRGRALGATKARVHLEGHDPYDEILADP